MMNKIIKFLAKAQYIAYLAIIVQIVRKLVNKIKTSIDKV